MAVLAIWQFSKVSGAFASETPHPIKPLFRGTIF